MTKTPERQEDKIIFILLNYIAIEGAIVHFENRFKVSFDCSHLLGEIEEIGIPAPWSTEQRIYDCADRSLAGETAAEKCWKALSRIRNNFVHANKAKIADSADKLEKLMDWSIRLIRHIESSEEIPNRVTIKKNFRIINW